MKRRRAGTWSRSGKPGVIVALAVAALVAGCDWGPNGPGTLSVTVSGATPLGAAVLEVTGPGVAGFSGQGDTRVYGTVVSATLGIHRVVAVSADGGALHLGIEVEDLGADPPVVVVLRSANTENREVSSAGVRAVVSEP
jgi:hypothetical protein